MPCPTPLRLSPNAPQNGCPDERTGLADERGHAVPRPETRHGGPVQRGVFQQPHHAENFPQATETPTGATW